MARHLKSAGTAAERAEREREEEARRAENLLRHGLAVARAREGLLPFAHIMMPDPADPHNADLSRYAVGRHHTLLSQTLMDVEAGKKRRVIVTMPPRHGKSQLSTRLLPAWFMGRRPTRQTIVAAYNEDKARDFGRDVLSLMKEPAYAQIFPGCRLDPGAKSAEHVRTLAGGEMLFAGVGGSATGYGADLLIIDDPFKNRKEADSQARRDDVWSWFLDVASTRLMPGGAIVVVLTRWHEDDLVGRIMNPAYVPEDLAAGWHIINLPAIAEAADPLGREVGEPLWPEWYGLEVLDEIKRTNPRGFISLYQQRPAPEEGSYFRKHMIKTYTQDQRPKNLRVYAASDHALSTDPQRDASVLLIFGVDADDQIWILDCWWGRAETDDLVSQMVRLMREWKPMQWFGANDNIFKTLRPFLNKRLREEEIWCIIDPIQETKDIEARAQSIRGRMEQGKVRYPSYSSWFADACSEILSFPSGKHDDFVAAIALIGMAMDKQVRAGRAAPVERAPPPVGSPAWVIWASRAEERQRKATAGANSWLM